MQSQFIATNNINLHVMTDGPENGTAVILSHVPARVRRTCFDWKDSIDKVFLINEKIPLVKCDAPY